MNTENEMNEEVRRLLDSLEEHGKNVRRQQELSDLIDSLSEKELGIGTTLLRGGTTKQSTLDEQEETSGLLRSARNDGYRRKIRPLWWVMGAAAACLLLWLLIKPSMKETPETNKEILVEETEPLDSVKTEVKDVILEEPVDEEQLLAEDKPQPGLLRFARNDEPQTNNKKTVQEQLLAENTTTEPSELQESTDTAIIGSNTIPASIEEKLSTINYQLSTQHSPQRRVIRSLNLVCYECQKEPEFFTKPVLEDRTLFGQPQDPNMKNGALAFEIKLN